MKRPLMLVPVIVIITAAVLFVSDSVNKSKQPQTPVTDTAAVQDTKAASTITWKSFTTNHDDPVNISFDYPDGSTVSEGATDTFQAYSIEKDGTWDVVTLILKDEQVAQFEAALVIGGATKTEDERGRLYRGGVLSDNDVIGNTSGLEIGKTPVAVYIHTKQYSPGFTAVLIDVGADWSPDVFDYFTRTFAFMRRS